MNHMLSEPPTRPATPHRGRRRWRGHGRMLAAVAAGTALAAGAAAYVVTAGSSPAAPASPAAGSRAVTPARAGTATGPAAGHVTLAAEILGAAAAHVAATRIAEPSPGQWIYYQTADYSYSAGRHPAPVTTDKEWITFDGSGSAYLQGGQLVTHTSTTTQPASGASPWAAWNATATPKTAYDVLASLPASPQALLTVIGRHAAGLNAGDAAGNPVAGQPPATQAQREFDLLTEILWNATVGVGGPPAAEAAAYRALATLPGISVQPGIGDIAGRRVIGVSDDGGYDQLLIDPASDQVVGIRNLSPGVVKTVKGSGDSPAKGTLAQEIVYLRDAEVAAPGDR